MKQIKINDESGDKNYFTIVPNFILNHSTGIAQYLYLQLKRLAGESGIAYPSSNYLIKKLGISKPTLRKEFKYLLSKGWIKYSGEISVETTGGKQKLKSYKIVDLWKLNNDFYGKGGKNITTLTQRGEKIDPQGGKARGEKIRHQRRTIKEEPYKKNNIAKQVLQEEFSFKDLIEKMKTDKNIHIRIIELYWRFKGWEFSNKEQYSAALKRELRASRNLSGYEFNRIEEVMYWLTDNTEIKWTLETVHKYIDENLNNLTKQQ